MVYFVVTQIDIILRRLTMLYYAWADKNSAYACEKV